MEKVNATQQNKPINYVIKIKREINLKNNVNKTNIKYVSNTRVEFN